MVRFSSLRLVTLVALAASVAGCSSNSATSDAGTDDACTALAQCCATIGGVGESTCQSLVTAAREANSEATCATTFQSYTQSGLCGGAFDAGGLPNVDASLPCALTGSCPTVDTGFDAGQDAGGTAPGAQCQYLGTCASGAEYDTCTATVDGGACIAAIVFPTTGVEILCASCLDCAAASASAATQCGNDTTTTVDAGPDCGTPPVLHPETDAGVYCPFAAAGSIHCNAGQECCEAPSAASGESTCQAAGVACPITGSLAWQCDGPVDCAGSAAGPVCCAAGSVALDPVCTYDRGSSFEGSHCAQSCVTGEVSLCTAATDPCPSSTTCTAFKVAGVVLGTCL